MAGAPVGLAYQVIRILPSRLRCKGSPRPSGRYAIVGQAGDGMHPQGLDFTDVPGRLGFPSTGTIQQ
jgi:hypothetical protein